MQQLLLVKKHIGAALKLFKKYMHMQGTKPQTTDMARRIYAKRGKMGTELPMSIWLSNEPLDHVQSNF